MKPDEMSLEEIKNALTDMGIPYIEGNIPDHLMNLITSYKYTPIPLMTDLTNSENVDAELGVVVRYNDPEIDNGIYIFTVLHSGQAGFIVVEPGTVTRAPMIRQVANKITNMITGIDLPPLMPFDMVEIAAHVMANTLMQTVMESCQVSEEYRHTFMRLYMPKFLADVGLYFVGAAKEDGSPMIYEETVNMEPITIWRSIQKGVSGHESDDRGNGEENKDRTGNTETGEPKKAEKTETKETEAGIRTGKTEEAKETER